MVHSQNFTEDYWLYYHYITGFLVSSDHKEFQCV